MITALIYEEQLRKLKIDIERNGLRQTYFCNAGRGGKVEIANKDAYRQKAIPTPEKFEELGMADVAEQIYNLNY